jgi:hypothetical protein
LGGTYTFSAGFALLAELSRFAEIGGFLRAIVFIATLKDFFFALTWFKFWWPMIDSMKPY